jgi:Divergent InlB B-repeat domain
VPRWALGLVLAACALAAANPARPAARALPRVTYDRPDDIAGPQVHVLYVVAADVPDRELDTTGEIAASVASWQSWLRGQTGGRGIRLDTYQGALDVTFFRLATTSSGALPRPAVAISTELAAAGFSAPDKIYAVYYDGTSTLTCGDGGGPYPSMYLTGSDSRSGTRCTGSFAASPPGYFDFGLLHELVHSLGYVPSCAPHAASQHVFDSGYDLMWGGGPWASLADMQLDVGHDDYFEARIPGCPDLSGSRFLEGGGARLGLTVTHREGAGGSVDVSLPERRLLACTGGCPVYLDTWPAPTVTLTARLDTVADEFEGWSGACQGADDTCTVQLDRSKGVEAIFGGRPPVLLRVEVRGSGKVTSAPVGILCPSRCAASFAYETRASLRATPNRGWRFGGWSRSDTCSKRDLVCDLTLVDPALVRASFVPVEVPVRVAVRGRGRVVSAPAALACPRRCFAKLRYGTTLELRAKPAPGSRFGGWTGSCGGTSRCRLSLTGSTSERRVRARFVRRL